VSETECILKQEAGVKSHESESPPTVGLKAGAFADLGTLILTNKRLIFIDKGGAARAAAWAVGGVFAAQAIENRVSKAELDELSSQKDSVAIPLENITRAEAGKKMGQSYIRVNSSGSQKPVHAFVVAGGNNNQDWASAINQAKVSAQYSPVAQAAVYMPQQIQQPAVQQQTSQGRICQNCGVAGNMGKFCTSCGSPLIQPQTEMPLPPPPPTQTPLCPYCGNQIRYIPQYQRWYCDKEKRYV
jgi:hypothetical protein